VTVKLYGNNSDQSIGYWISPVIPAGGMAEYSIATIEAGLKLTAPDAFVPPSLVKQDYWGLSVQTDIDGFFQHVLSAPDGALTNLSTCLDAVTTGDRTLMGVHSSIMDASQPSLIVVTNSGSAEMRAAISFYDARSGGGLNHYITDPIPAGGLVTLNVSTMEAAMNHTPDAGMKYYVLKLEQPFTGFLQHLVNNRSQGVVVDMTAACMM
jgi:hypothetical protein